MESWHITLGGLGLLVLAGLASAPDRAQDTFHVAAKPGPAKPTVATGRARAVQESESPMSNVDIRNAEFDRVLRQAEAGGKVSERDKREFTDELIRRLEKGGPQH